MKLTLIRHPPVTANGICYGQSEVPLQPGWESQVQSLLTKLVRPEVILSSPLQRCLALASKLQSHFCVDVCSSPWLMELNFGVWEQQSWRSIGQEAIDRWAQDVLGFSAPEGENCRQLATRVKQGFDSWITRYGEQSRRLAECHAMIVGHSGSIRCLAVQLTGKPLKTVLDLVIEPLGVMHLVQIQDEWRYA